MRPQPGDLINGKYRLVRLIGDGGMGSVFEARHEYLGTAVALKFLHPELARRPGLVARFLREARLSASIKSHHIAHVTDVDQASDGVAYLVMELLEGQSLMTILEREKKLPLDVALDYTMQMLAGLEAAHAVGVVHRDLKPDNVFVVNTPRGPLVKLLDFGIAKLRSTKEFQVALTRPGVMMGTPEYMAPEQAFSADSVDARADVYSIGAMLYEMLAGARPAHGEDAQQIAAFILGSKVARLSKTNPSVSEGLADVVHRAMAPSPADRFVSATDLRNALLPFCGSLSLAGRLAATPMESGGGVAPTWPPEAEPERAPTKAAVSSTESRPAPANPPAIAPSAHAAPSNRHAATQAAAWSPMQPPAPAVGYPPPAYGFDPGGRPDPVRAAPTRARGPRRQSMWLLLVMVGLAVAIVVVAVAMGDSTTRRAPPASAAPVPAAPPPTATTPAIAAARATAVSPAIAPPIQPPKEPAVPAANRPTKAQHAADAGTEDAPSNKTLPGVPPFPFPLPSAFPLPTTLPLPLPIPSGFPPIGLPGFPQPPPAGSQ